MQKLLCGLVVAISLNASAAVAQKATEQFIPMGQSPGLSDRLTDRAAIVSIDGDRREVTIRLDGAEKQVRVTQETRIWLDRTRYGRPSLAAGFEDLAPGQEVEIHYGDATQEPAVAAWIKAVPRPEP